MSFSSPRPSRVMREIRRSRHAAAAIPLRRGQLAAPSCVVTRRIIDDLERPWSVREIPVAAPYGRRSVSLFFRCEVAGVRAEVRSSGRRLEMLSNDELVTTLLRADE